MGNYKFRLSDMIRPNAWFHKNHKDTTTCTDSKQKTDTPSPSKASCTPSSLALAVPNQCPNNTTNQQPHLSDPRKSYRFTHLHQKPQVIKTKFHVEPPRKSSRRRRSTKKNRALRTNVAASVSASCSCRTTLKAPDSTPEQYPNSCLDQTSSSELESMLNEYGSETPDTFDAMLSCSTSSCKCRVVLNNDSVHDIDNETGQFCHRVLELAPIITKNHNQKTNFQRTNTSSSPGFKMRTNSPRIANRRVQGGRKSAVGGSHVYASFAVVKSSRDPRRDFRESMVEMIVENNIMGSSKDLEQLLACYLSLNSDEYHDIIISVFKQIWFDFIHVPTK